FLVRDDPFETGTGFHRHDAPPDPLGWPADRRTIDEIAPIWRELEHVGKIGAQGPRYQFRGARQDVDQFRARERLLPEFSYQTLLLGLFAHPLVGILALEELADLTADHAHRAQQPLVRFADSAAIEGEHADRLAFRDHGEVESAPHAR